MILLNNQYKAIKHKIIISKVHENIFFKLKIRTLKINKTYIHKIILEKKIQH